MNSGGEPERDDTGLPPVDIEIPDDARELERDVQAYYREQRARRRQQRGSRLRGLLAKDGIVMPLLACCLILALITGTLLTVFTAASDQGFQNLPVAGGPGHRAHTPSTGRTGSANTGAPPTRPARPGASGRGGATSGTGRSTGPTAAGPVAPIAALPNTTVQVSGKQVALRRLSRAMLVLVPPKCACAPAVIALALFAVHAEAQVYLVSAAGASQLADQVDRHGPARITVAVDSGHVLDQYQHGLTAVLVGPDHDAGYASHLKVGENFGGLLEALTG